MSILVTKCVRLLFPFPLAFCIKMKQHRFWFLESSALISLWKISTLLTGIMCFAKNLNCTCSVPASFWAPFSGNDWQTGATAGEVWSHVTSRGLSVRLTARASCFNVSPELTEVLSEDFQGSLQEVLDGVSLLHLQEKNTQRQWKHEDCMHCCMLMQGWN